MRILFICTLCYVFLFGLLSSCGTLQKPFYANTTNSWESLQKTSDKRLVHSLYLVGDAGALDDKVNNKNYVLEAVKQHLDKSKGDETLVYLGDNLYDHGLVNKKHPKRNSGEMVLNAQLEVAHSVNGNTIFVAGNHDWNKGKKGGLKYVKRQEKYIESYLDEGHNNKVRMYPGKGCADPKVVKINKDLVFLFLDTQWWLQQWDEEKNINDGCEIKSKSDLLHSIEEIFTEHKNDEIVVLMHHPIMSNGTHGGKFSLKHHLFPLTELNKDLWIPLPIIGSAYPVFRQITGSVQDITNGRNQEIMQGIDQIATRLRVDVIFASGHEHSLQYFDLGKKKYIISGSGAKQTFTVGGGNAEYARQARGFAKLLFYEDLETWVEFYTVMGFNQKPVLEYRTLVREARAGSIEERNQYLNISERDTVVAANESFQAGKFKSLFMGYQYRAMWSTKVKVPIINLNKEYGGLTPIKKGGGMSSNSLRMEAEDGKQYILRSINKDYTKLVPPQFGNLKVLDVMKDQNSASHPYGALVVPELSKAADIYYTHPKLVYLKHQEGLGNYNSQFPEELYLLEQRPSGDWSDASQFGNSSEIIGYTDLLEIIRTKKHHFIDQEWVCKSRMFDLLIHDWDRHDDQWRWASFKENKDRVIYRPIPRDRDQVFYKFKGLVPTIIASAFVKKFKTMKAEVKDVKNLAFNARYFDRYFMNDLDWSDWEKIITSLQTKMTDQAIESSFATIPEEVRDIDSPQIISYLKSRRIDLKIIGRKLYDYLAQEVEISGTDNDDRFEININENQSIIIKYFIPRKDKSDLLKYSRTFLPSETKEIRLFGLRGKDHFIIKGASNSNIKIRIIGGEDKDKLINNTNYKAIIYDDLDGLKLDGDKVKLHLSDQVENNEYIRNSFVYNTVLTLPIFGFSKDDGFWVGLTTNWKTHGWRKSPFKSSQKVGVQFAPGSQKAFKANYSGVFTKAFGQINFKPSVNIEYPSYENFFGLGNESKNELREKEYNWVRKRAINISPLLSLISSNHQVHLDFGPVFQSVSIENIPGRVADDELNGFEIDDFERKNFLGGIVKHEIHFVDRPSKPVYGIKFDIGVGYLSQINNDNSFWNFAASMQTYLCISAKPELVLANNIGLDFVKGETQFYQLPNLGNNQNLRGYRNNRYRGTTAFFENVDLRLKLFESDNNVIPFDFGVLGGYDVGRVWLDDEEGDLWHDSFTFGMWFDLLGTAILQPYYSWTDDENLFSLRLGFNF